MEARAVRAVLFFLLFLAWGGACQPTPEPTLVAPVPAAKPVRYEDARRVLDQRCVVCHACYDAPCQLVLGSQEGLLRGASKKSVYHGARLVAAKPTRLSIDARSPEAWRRRGFWSVLGRENHGASLLFQMMALGRTHPFQPDQRLPADFELDITRALSCPDTGEFNAYAAARPKGGMPYGTAPLSEAEWTTLAAWVEQGATAADTRADLPAAAAQQITDWETFLNGETLKERITARYLYEHWFLAHLYFPDRTAGPFFRVVRSRTAPGLPADEIATRRPYDAPGVERFWYRLIPVNTTIVHKTHIVYPLGPERMERLRALFLEPAWSPTRFPSYRTSKAANPFVSFDQIPARSRYQFLLDDARYFVMTFIRGPVCRGQTAVDVIEDQFFVMFLDPDADVSVVDPAFLDSTKTLLELPADAGKAILPTDLWLAYDLKQRLYLERRVGAYKELDPEGRGFGLDAIWDGDGHDRNALLTVFRNFDNAMVRYGFLGEMPETAWVIDYPTFERIYYDLVAAFDVFGTVRHQLLTRLYMDHLRMQSETLFLAFLPTDRREAIRASWYVGATDDRSYKIDRIRSGEFGTRIAYRSDDPMPELLAMVEARNPDVSGEPDRLNRCRGVCDRPSATPLERRAEAALRKLAAVRGAWVARMPEISLLHVRPEAGTGVGGVYTLVHNRAHTNVASLFKEDARLEPAKDTLSVARGVLASYPNFLFEVDAAEVDAFADQLLAVQSDTDFAGLVERFGVRRTSPRFWPAFDLLHKDFHQREPTAAGILDLNRYENL